MTLNWTVFCIKCLNEEILERKIPQKGGKRMKDNMIKDVGISFYHACASAAGLLAAFRRGCSALTTIVMLGLKSASYWTHNAATAAIWSTLNSKLRRYIGNKYFLIVFQQEIESLPSLEMQVQFWKNITSVLRLYNSFKKGCNIA